MGRGSQLSLERPIQNGQHPTRCARGRCQRRHTPLLPLQSTPAGCLPAGEGSELGQQQDIGTRGHQPPHNKVLYSLFCFFRSSIEHCLYRRADCLIFTMNTAQPATWTAHPLLEFTDRPFNMLLSRLVLLDEGNPAYPLIACKWREILPYC